MVKPTILEEEAITAAQVKKHLDAIESSEGELNFRSQRTKEYLEEFPPLDAKKAKEVATKLEELGLTRLKHDQIVKIIDILPRTEEELAVVLQGFSITISKGDLKKVISALDDVRSS